MGTPSGKIPHLRIPVPLAYELTTGPFMGGGADGEHLGENLHLGIPAPLAYKLTTAPMGREADVGYLGDPQIAHLSLGKFGK